MIYCPLCGTPWVLPKIFSWRSNGTFTIVNDETQRFCLLDTEAIITSVENISSELPEISDVVFQATKLAGCSLLENLLCGFSLMLIGLLDIFKNRLKYRLISEICSTLGYGRPQEIRECGSGKIEIQISNPFYPPASAGLISGMIEYLSGHLVSAFYEPQSEARLIVSVLPTCRKASISPLGSDIPVVSGRNVLELCTACRTPLDLSSRFFFDTERGEIQEIRNSGRVAFVDVACLRAILNEVEQKTESDIAALILRLEKERVRRILASEEADLALSADEYMKHARTLRIRGMGNASSASVSGRSAKVRVDNPYHEALVAAFIAGFHEAVTGKKSSVEWTLPVRGTTYVSVTTM